MALQIAVYARHVSDERLTRPPVTSRFGKALSHHRSDAWRENGNRRWSIRQGDMGKVAEVVRRRRRRSGRRQGSRAL